MPRSSRDDLDSAAGSLNALAALVRTGRGFRHCLIEWPSVAAPAQLDLIGSIAAAAQVGCPLGRIADVASERGEFGAHIAPALAAAVEAQRRGAGPVAATLEQQADSLRRRAARAAQASAATAGARLSGRLVAGLPLAFLLLMPEVLTRQIDAVGVGILSVGVALIALGLRWIARLLPEPGEGPPIVSIATDLAASIESGMPYSAALDAVARNHAWAPIEQARAQVVLGAGWIQSLRRTSDPHCVRLASIFDSGRHLGTGTTEGLLGFADEIRTYEELGFEHALRRAPVRMVVPLVVCVLPGFAMLTVGPFLRDLLT